MCSTPRRKGWAVGGQVGEPLTATTPGRIYDYKGAFPYAVFVPSSTSLIVGQLIMMDNFSPEFRNMDRIETCSGYRRKTVTVTLLDGTYCTALAYEADLSVQRFDLDFMPRVLSGDWNDLLPERICS